MAASYITTYGGWAGIVAIAGGYLYLTKRTAAPPPNKVSEKDQATAASIKKDVKQKTTKANAVESIPSGGEQSETGSKKKNKKKNKETAPVAAAPVQQQAPINESDDEDSEEIDIKEFARQMSQKKMGASVEPRPETGSRQRSVKPSRANTAGFNTTSDDASNQGGVADMLEAPAGGPSVLRVTSPVNPQPKKQRQANAQEQAPGAQAKKNAKKAEEKRRQNEEAEAGRLALMERSRRAAREARGETAKNGAQFDKQQMAKAAATSVWKGPEGPNSAPTNGHIQEAAAPQQSAQIGNDYASLPSEEEQFRQAIDDTTWEEVPSKKSKNKTKKVEENVKPVEAPAAVQNKSNYVPLSQRNVQGMPAATVQTKSHQNGEDIFQSYNLDNTDTWEV